MVQGLAREFAEQEVKPIAAECDREARFPHATVKRMGELGLMGIAVPEKRAAAAPTRWPTCWRSKRSRSPARPTPSSCRSTTRSYCGPLAKYGTARSTSASSTPLASGRALGCFALTEPQAGSDARNQTTLARARRRRLRAERPQVFVTNGRESSVALVFVQTDRAKGAPRHLRLPGREGHAGLHGGQGRGQARHPRLGHGGAALRGLPRPGAEPPGRRGRRLQDRHGGARRRAHRHRRAGGRASRPGRYERVGGLRAGAQELRRAHRRAPDGPVDAGRHGDGDRRRRGS